MKEQNEDTVLPSDPERSFRCPQCGEKLIKRPAGSDKKAGNHYWGCSKYPSCQFKLPIL
jgi:ssDNA-binding Zn-finger/Zn-ribbon topoisomerase 1